MSADPRWTDETRERIADVMRVLADEDEAEIITWEDLATAVLADLADAGLLLPGGGPYAPHSGKQCGQPHPDYPESRCHRARYHAGHATTTDAREWTLAWLDSYPGQGDKPWQPAPEEATP